jgi:hypothetical protein
MKNQSAKAAKRPGRKPSGKVTLQLRVIASTKEILERCARARQQSPSEYADELLQQHFARAALPDFAERFARPPKGPHVGDQFVELLLAERDQS